MQKELKIGIAIGAVLLVVLIVYLAVPKNEGTDVAQNEDVTLTEENSSGTDAPPAAPAGDTPAAPTGTEQAKAEGDIFAPTGGGSAADPAKPDSSGDVWVTALNTGELPITTTPPLAAIPGRPGETATPPAGQEATVGDTAETAPSGTDTTAGAGEPVVDRSRGGTAQELTTPTPVVPEPGPEAPAAGARTHKVQRGETFSSIAKHVYGEERFYIAIQNANPTLDPSRVRPGTTINLPDAATVKGAGSSSPAPSGGSSSQRAIDSETEHRVESGDSLYKISVKRFGTPSMTEAIYDLNKQTIGSDSSRLKVGTVLKLPAKPASDSSASR